MDTITKSLERGTSRKGRKLSEVDNCNDKGKGESREKAGGKVTRALAIQGERGGRKCSYSLEENVKGEGKNQGK